MALDKTTLITEIKAISNTLKTYDGSTGKTMNDAINKYASDLADAIEKFVKSAAINIDSGITPNIITVETYTAGVGDHGGALASGGGPVAGTVKTALKIE